jgi:hypothetical protein
VGRTVGREIRIICLSSFSLFIKRKTVLRPGPLVGCGPGPLLTSPHSQAVSTFLFLEKKGKSLEMLGVRREKKRFEEESDSSSQRRASNLFSDLFFCGRAYGWLFMSRPPTPTHPSQAPQRRKEKCLRRWSGYEEAL